MSSLCFTAGSSMKGGMKDGAFMVPSLHTLSLVVRNIWGDDFHVSEKLSLNVLVKISVRSLIWSINKLQPGYLSLA